MISVLIPVYNCRCRDLVESLHRQFSYIEDINYEIIVADDGSTDSSITEENKAIEAFPNVIYIIRKENVGRARIRNFLAQKAQYPRLLFIDGDMTLRKNDFIQQYLQHPEADVIDGGYTIGEGRGLSDREKQYNLRYQYELKSIHSHSVERRKEHPYQHFHTSNFIVSRDMMLQNPLDERFLHYGFEDVLWGKQLKEKGIGILHIDNPVVFDDFETNLQFIEKTEESLRTLHQFQQELDGYSHILSLAKILKPFNPLLKIIYKTIGKPLRNSIIHNKPHQFVFNIYKLIYFSQIKNA